MGTTVEIQVHRHPSSVMYERSNPAFRHAQENSDSCTRTASRYVSLTQQPTALSTAHRAIQRTIAALFSPQTLFSIRERGAQQGYHSASNVGRTRPPEVDYANPHRGASLFPFGSVCEVPYTSVASVSVATGIPLARNIRGMVGSGHIYHVHNSSSSKMTNENNNGAIHHVPHFTIHYSLGRHSEYFFPCNSL